MFNHNHCAQNAHPAASANLQGLEGWQLAARGVQMAINNRVEEGQELLKVDSSCIHRQAGLCYLSFIVSINMFSKYFNYRINKDSQ